MVMMEVLHGVRVVNKCDQRETGTVVGLFVGPSPPETGHGTEVCGRAHVVDLTVLCKPKPKAVREVQWPPIYPRFERGAHHSLTALRALGCLNSLSLPAGLWTGASDWLKAPESLNTENDATENEAGVL